MFQWKIIFRKKNEKIKLLKSQIGGSQKEIIHTKISEETLGKLFIKLNWTILDVVKKNIKEDRPANALMEQLFTEKNSEIID